MKAAVLRKPGNLKVEDVPAPEVQRGEALVRVKATAVCGTDVSIFKGKTAVDYPRILGHESAGEVVKIGAGLEGFEAGDKVVMSPTLYCGYCPACLRGQSNICENGGLFGREIDGSYAEYVTVPRDRLFKIPDSISFVDATTFALLTTVVYSQRKIDVFAGQSVVVIGEGPAGMLQTKLAKLNGADPVIGISRSQWKLDRAAEKYEADFTFNQNLNQNIMELTDGRGADIVIECAGKGETLNLATELVRPGGTILAFGITPPQIDNFSSYSLYYKDINIVGSRAMQSIDWPLSIKLATSDKIDIGSIISHRVPLADIEEGLLMKEDTSSRVLRVVIEI